MEYYIVIWRREDHAAMMTATQTSLEKPAVGDNSCAATRLAAGIGLREMDEHGETIKALNLAEPNVTNRSLKQRGAP